MATDEGRVQAPDECRHAWGEWQFSEVDDAQFRLCSLCGVMEQQWLEPDRDHRYGMRCDCEAPDV